jgi:homogentisate 1,2-dioxygenase
MKPSGSQGLPLETQPALSGFGSYLTSEALPGALPVGRNSPQRPAYGLYAEVLSGSAFTAPRHSNFRTWTYRIWPSARHDPFTRYDQPNWLTAGRAGQSEPTNPAQLRWDPLSLPSAPTDFVDGLISWALNGDAATQTGMAVHLYACNRSMQRRALFNAQGEMLIVPQKGRLRVHTELGTHEIEPLQIVLIPRGIRFSVELLDQTASGYVCENYGAAFRLPELGPLGSNGLANPRDFVAPSARYQDQFESWQLFSRFDGALWQTQLDHCPFDVVAWHGNLIPFKYDLRHFNAIGSISFDHPDPSIFTVLTAPSDTLGTANVDFVIFPPRWLVAENTFRPPWYHRNCMSEFMGLLQGVYDAKPDGFVAGGCSLHNAWSGHGPDAPTHAKASAASLAPQQLIDTMAFMFESRFVMRPTPQALRLNSQGGQLQPDYYRCWSDLQRNFDPTKP